MHSFHYFNLYVDLSKNYSLTGGTPYSDLCVTVGSIAVGPLYVKLSYKLTHCYDRHVGNFWRVSNI